MWVYWNVEDEADNGTIIQFIEHRKSLNLGHIRKELRPWIGETTRPQVQVKHYAGNVTHNEKTLKDVHDNFKKMKRMIADHKFLNKARNIPQNIILDKRFEDCLYMDRYKNAIFPHYDHEKLMGYEIKNFEFTGFASGGSKALWLSKAFRHDNVLV